MAQARPVVAVPVGGVVELVRADDTGWLAADVTVAAPAAAMRAAVAASPSLRRSLGERARTEVERRFGRVAMCAAWDALHARLVC